MFKQKYKANKKNHLDTSTVMKMVIIRTSDSHIYSWKLFLVLAKLWREKDTGSMKFWLSSKAEAAAGTASSYLPSSVSGEALQLVVSAFPASCCWICRKSFKRLKSRTDNCSVRIHVYISLYKIKNNVFVMGEFITAPFVCVSGTVNQLQPLNCGIHRSGPKGEIQ